MISIISACILSIVATLDNLIIGVYYGSRKMKLSWKHNIIISTTTIIITTISLLFGSYISQFMTARIGSIVGGLSLIIIGIWFLMLSIKDKGNVKVKSKGKLTLKNLIYVGLLLSINNLPIAMALGMVEQNTILITCFFYMFSILFLKFGNLLGSRLNVKNIDIASSITIIIIGVMQTIL
ncbi:MAG: manganese efflux pump [Clostridia bacterium]|nr:manganese efflux pump [Clostridia bacterium]MDD4376385.1 manganese efflux pump [Clostridia bacterium]